MDSTTTARRFDEVIAAIRAGKTPDALELSDHLWCRSAAERVRRNFEVGSALLDAGQRSAALVYLDRARTINPAVPMREAAVHFRALTEDGRPRDALDMLRGSALAAFEAGDAANLAEVVKAYHLLASRCGQPCHDAVLFQLARTAFRAGLVPPTFRPEIRDRRVRIGYVVLGECDPQCMLPGIYVGFGQCHDRARWDPVYFTLEPAEQALKNPAFAAEVAEMKKIGAEYVATPKANGTLGRARALSEAIRAARIDVVVFQNQLREYFIAALMRPAPLMTSFDHGLPQAYGSWAVDLMLGPHRMFAMDSLVDFAFITNLGFVRHAARHAPPYTRAELGLPDGKRLLVSSGLAPKFVHPSYWRLVVRLLRDRPDAILAVVGIGPDGLAAEPRKIIGPDVADRIFFLGFRKDIARIIPLAEVLVDTVPVGGGYAVVEAVMEGIPCVIQHHDFARPFSKTENYAPLAEMFVDRDLAVPARDSGAYLRRIHRLLDDPAYARDLAARQKAEIARHHDGPTYVRNIEAALEAAIEARIEARERDTQP